MFCSFFHPAFQSNFLEGDFINTFDVDIDIIAVIIPSFFDMENKEQTVFERKHEYLAKPNQFFLIYIWKFASSRQVSQFKIKVNCKKSHKINGKSKKERILKINQEKKRIQR